MQRTGELSGFIFLCLLIFNSDSLASESLNDLTTKLEMEYGISISKQSLDERFNEKAVNFLKIAIEELLSRQLANTGSLEQWTRFKRVLIKDSVCFQVDESLAEFFPGCGGSGSPATVRIQFEYDLLTGKVVDLSLHGFTEQDATNSLMTLEVINEGDLVIRDLAYMHFAALKGILDQLGHFLCRLQANRQVYQIQNGKTIELDFEQIVEAMEECSVSKIEEKVFLDRNLSLEVRLFIYLLPQQVYQERIRKANKNAQKKGRQLSKEFKVRAKLNLFITSAPEDLLDLDNAWKAYTLRWQIELGFKVWKSLWKIDKVKKVKLHRLECYIWSKLFIIILCQQVLWIIKIMMRGLYEQNLSLYKASKTLVYSVEKLKEALLSGTTATVHYLIWFLELSRRRHLLEMKKGGNYSPKVFSNVFSMTYLVEVSPLGERVIA